MNDSPLSPEAVAQMVADLTTKAAMINMGEKIAWGSDSGVMDATADMLTTLAAENATLRAERAMLKFDIDKMLTQIEEHNAAWDELRASEAAALDRADTARDAALVEAAGTLEAQALDADAQAKRFRGGSDPWADRTARSRALRNSAAAILALRDNASFIMNSKTAGAVRKMKDADGRFMWSDGLAAAEPARLMGYPVLICEDMPDIAANAYAMAFGDFESAYTIVERPDLRILRHQITGET